MQSVGMVEGARIVLHLRDRVKVATFISYPKAHTKRRFLHQPETSFWSHGRG